MKVFVLALALTTMAYANSSVGLYTSLGEVMVMSASGSKAECNKVGGRLEGRGRDAACFVKTEDKVQIKRVRGMLRLSVSTVGTNLHMCEFEAIAIQRGPVITSRLKSQKYDPETDSFKPVICVVTGELSEEGQKISISSNENCQEFCGANAWISGEFKRI